MDNQNTNGLNENKTGVNPNNQPIPRAVANEASEDNGNVGTTPVSTPIEPVKPTLDSILNGDSEISAPTTTPIETIDTLESPAPMKTTIVEEPNPTTIVNTVAQPETIQNDAVVDTSAETFVNPVVPEQPVAPTVESSAPLENTVLETPQPTIETIEPTEEATTNGPIIETIEEIPNEPVVENTIQQPVDTNVTTETLETPTEPTLEPTLPPVDDFNEVPVPPTTDGTGKNRKKDGKKKTWILLLILILIVAIGFGVYYFLTMAKTSSEKVINTKDVKVELGSALSNNIDDYATIAGYNKNDCSLNLDNVNVEKVSTYKYTITCGKTNKEGLVIVDDTTKPEVVTNDVMVALNTTLNVEDFIEECKDASKCSYHFQTNVEDLTKNIGEYDVEILVSDEYNNQTIVTAKLTVSRTAPTKYLTCKKTEEILDELGATFVEGYKIGFDANDTFHSAVRTSEFTFKNTNDYNKAVSDYKSANSLNNRSGDATYNESKMSILLKENKTLQDMNTDLNGRLPNNFNILRAYLSGLGYTCN